MIFITNIVLYVTAGMSLCLISISLVAMARTTSTTTMPTSRGVKSSFWGLPPIAILPSRAYPEARPETYSALTSSRGCHGLIPFSWGRGKPSIGEIYPGLWARGLRHRRGTGAQAHVSAGEARKDIRK